VVTFNHLSTVHWEIPKLSKWFLWLLRYNIRHLCSNSNNINSNDLIYRLCLLIHAYDPYKSLLCEHCPLQCCSGSIVQFSPRCSNIHDAWSGLIILRVFVRHLNVQLAGVSYGGNYSRSTCWAHHTQVLASQHPTVYGIHSYLLLSQRFWVLGAVIALIHLIQGHARKAWEAKPTVKYKLCQHRGRCIPFSPFLYVFLW